MTLNHEQIKKINNNEHEILKNNNNNNEHETYGSVMVAPKVKRQELK